MCVFPRGAHGVLQSSDIYSKSSEFYAWCMEVKHQAREQMTKREEKELFAEFAEDFNTSTLPHEKYYDLEKVNRTNRLSHSLKFTRARQHPDYAF